MKIGFIVNPIAGMGGKVGLKGTDGVLKEAIERGAEAVAPKRAEEFLRRLTRTKGNIEVEILTCPGIMGEDEARNVNFPVQILPMKIGEETSAEDTRTAAELLVSAKVDLIVFVGGDGTARDIFDAVRGRIEVPVLGVPAGVKMYSGIFAINPSEAVSVVLAFAEKEAEIAELEIMDADEKAIRSDTFSLRLYGYLKGPFVPMRIQGSKQVTPETVNEKENQMAIARFIIEEMDAEATYILGPGTTVKLIAELLNAEKTILGVDIYKRGRAILDVDEKKILTEVDDWQNAWVILSPIGRQGILLGRGNQQISPEVIKRVGKQHIIVAATKGKLESIEG
ncbi:MAG: ATP-NAD kinase family protein, partial [Candidatus Bathycorpusculaceae bacterium]